MSLSVCYSMLNLANVDPMVSASMSGAIYYAKHKRPDLNVRMYNPERLPIHISREDAVQYALDCECDYIFFHDNDTIMHLGTVDRLITRLEERKDLYGISARYYIRGRPYKLMLFRPDKPPNVLDCNPSPESEDEWTDEDGIAWGMIIGMGCTLLRTGFFNELPKPWFRTGDFHTEDVYLCHRAYNMLDDWRVGMDMTFGPDHIVGKNVVNMANVEMMRTLSKMEAVLRDDPDKFKEIKEVIEQCLPKE